LIIAHVLRLLLPSDDEQTAQMSAYRDALTVLGLVWSGGGMTPPPGFRN
jgi:hypothetical protein